MPLGSKRNILLWSACVALGLHFLFVTPYARWIEHGLWPNVAENELDIELLQLRPPDPQKEKDRWQRLPEEKKKLSHDAKEDPKTKPGQLEAKGQHSQKVGQGQTQKKGGKPIDEEVFTRGPNAESPELLEELNSHHQGEFPSETQSGMQFTMNSYKWSWQRYMENWAVDLGRWWMPPQDYMSGQWPEGGFAWVKVRLSKEGEMLSYKILQHNVSSEMKLMVVQALIGARLREPLPPDFPEEYLEVSWKFIYPPFEELMSAMRGARQQGAGPRK